MSKQTNEQIERRTETTESKNRRTGSLTNGQKNRLRGGQTYRHSYTERQAESQRPKQKMADDQNDGQTVTDR